MQQLYKLTDLSKFDLQTLDGELGHIEQIYFDDQQWLVRYFIVRTGNWLFGQDVLIDPAMIEFIDEENNTIKVKLTREQIKNSPPMDTKMPVSRHYEREYYRYYDWEPYWYGDPFFEDVPLVPPQAIPEKPEAPDNPHLRSSVEVNGYHIQTKDGAIGHVDDFVLDNSGKKIRYIQIDTRNWLPAKNVLISPAWIEGIDWSKNELAILLEKKAIETAPTFDPSKVISRDYQVKLFKHYGMEYEDE